MHNWKWHSLSQHFFFMKNLSKCMWSLPTCQDYLLDLPWSILLLGIIFFHRFLEHTQNSTQWRTYPKTVITSDFKVVLTGTHTRSTEYFFEYEYVKKFYNIRALVSSLEEQSPLSKNDQSSYKSIHMLLNNYSRMFWNILTGTFKRLIFYYITV